MRHQLAPYRSELTWLGLVGLSVLCVLFLIVLPSPSSGRAQPTTEFSGTLRFLDGPTVINAGGSIMITLEVVPEAQSPEAQSPETQAASQETDTARISVVVVSAVATRQLEVILRNGRGQFYLGPPWTEHAGTISILANAQTLSLDRLDIEVRPGPVTGPIVPIVGQRTIVADGNDQAMVVIVPSDQYGNAITDQSVVISTLSYPGGSTLPLMSRTENLVAYSWFESSTVAGNGSVHTTSRDGTVSGPSVEFIQVAGPPNNLDLLHDGLPHHADGRTLVEVNSGVLVDTFGNVLPDGVIVGFTIQAPDGWQQQTAIVVDGIASIRFPAPTLPGTITVRAHTGDVKGDSIEIEFSPAISHIPVSTLVTAGSVVVDIGPILDVRGGFIPDGTIVHVNNHDTSIRDGMASVSLNTHDLASLGGKVTVSSLGTTAVIRP